MIISQTKIELQGLLEHSENLKKGFSAMVLLAPQILDEEDLHELKEVTLKLATNFDTMSSHLHSFARIGTAGKKFCPSNKIN